jgi:hypothetical protein
VAIYYVDDQIPAHEVGIVYPDVEIVQPSLVPVGVLELGSVPVITPPTLVLPAPIPLRVRLPRVEVRDTASNDLVTSIEILSPTNKREPGLTRYKQMREELLGAGVHLIEIDLIRRGRRPWLPTDEDIPDSPYLALVTRADHQLIQIWAIQLEDELPTLPIPLRFPDPDVYLDVQTALTIICDESDYQLTLDYTQPPPRPALCDEKQRWLNQHLQAARLRS